MAEQVFAIDPGTTSSALVVMRGMDIERAEIIGNAQMVRRLQLASGNCHLAIEMVACYGMPVLMNRRRSEWLGSDLARK